MLATILISVGFKGLSAVAGIFLVAGGYLGYRYGSKVAAKASADLSKAKAAAGDLAKKV